MLSVNLSSENYSRLCQVFHEEAEQAIAFVNVTFRVYYNKIHKSVFYEDESLVYLYFFHRYIISDLTNWKLLNQCVDLFQIWQ